MTQLESNRPSSVRNDDLTLGYAWSCELSKMSRERIPRKLQCGRWMRTIGGKPSLVSVALEAAGVGHALDMATGVHTSSEGGQVGDGERC